jgi:signal transduction histidine kinase
MEQANIRQEGLLHFMSHQIKGYLTKSKAAFSGILEGDYGETPPSLNEMVKIALADNNEGVETITSILSASNLKKGTTKFEKISFDFQKMVENQITTHKKQAEGKNLSLDVEVAPNENYAFVGDMEQLGKHAIGNLIDNSIKYTQTGGLKVSLSKKDGKILFSVKDTGVGINDEDKKRLFTEGGRGKDSIKINVNSTGYGLFIARQIVEAHGGRIWAESEGAGKGSIFFVQL